MSEFRVPNGWKLVPEEPTREMLVAGVATNGVCPIYSAMLAAAPAAPVTHDPYAGCERECGGVGAICRCRVDEAVERERVQREAVVTTAPVVQVSALRALADRLDSLTSLRGKAAADVREVWRDLFNLATAQPAPIAQAEQEPVAWMTHHDEPMFFSAEKEAAAYCDNDESPIPLYVTPPAHPDASALVGALEKIKSDTLKDDPLDHYDVACDALKAYRAALTGKGGDQ